MSQGVDQASEKARTGDGPKNFPPQGQLFGPPFRRRRQIQGRGGGPGLLRGDGAAAGGDDVLRRDGSRQQMPGHAVRGGGIEALAGEEGLGCVCGHDLAVKEQGAPVGIFGAELHIMADHDDAHAPCGQILQNGGE